MLTKITNGLKQQDNGAWHARCAIFTAMLSRGLYAIEQHQKRAWLDRTCANTGKARSCLQQIRRVHAIKCTYSDEEQSCQSF